MEASEDSTMAITVREYDHETDLAGAIAVDRMCEVGPAGSVSLFTDLLGDPICRVRNSPAFLMLVAETSSPRREIVGLIRGCVKSVSCGEKTNAPIYTKAAYILGLRVAPSHRRLGIGAKLVLRMEEWFISKKAEYSYMATDNDNTASISLFINHLHYSKFRAPAILVHPVFSGHKLPISRAITLIRLPPADAEKLYRRRFAAVEFFPRDIDAVLNNPLSLGTFLAIPSSSLYSCIDRFLSNPPESWALLSVWDCNSLFHLELRGVTPLLRALAWTSRAADRAFPWLKIPSFPNLFRPFGGYFLYGVGGEGVSAKKLLRELCFHAHNLARSGGCGAVATEVAACEPLKDAIPHWKKLSCSVDLWCMKRLVEEDGGPAVADWTRSPPANSIFVDPREV